MIYFGGYGTVASLGVWLAPRSVPTKKMAEFRGFSLRSWVEAVGHPQSCDSPWLARQSAVRQALPHPLPHRQCLPKYAPRGGKVNEVSRSGSIRSPSASSACAPWKRTAPSRASWRRRWTCFFRAAGSTGLRATGRDHDMNRQRPNLTVDPLDLEDRTPRRRSA
jgi:hypothetical protein